METIRLASLATYLHVSRRLDGPHAPRFETGLSESLTDVLSKWTASTRISPLWRVESVGVTPIRTTTKAGLDGDLLFIGPIRPHAAISGILLPIANNSVRAIWLGLGLYNVIALMKLGSPIDKIRKVAEELDANWEHWTVRKGHIVETSHSNRRVPVRAWRSAVVGIAKILESPDGRNHTSLQEFLPLVSSALSRAELHAPRFLTNLEAHLPIVKSAFESNGRTAPEKQGQLTHVNAAVSRFASLAFAGASPILVTESHFWTHSLLGIGTASLGLQNLADYIYENMGLHLVPERIEATKNVEIGKFPLLADLELSDEKALKHYLDECDPTQAHGSAKPLITYFSGRDGFKSNISVISVPLSAVTAANAKPFSLMTLTHEVSHIVIGAILHKLLPLRHDAKSLLRCCQLIKQPKLAKDRYEVVQSALMQSFAHLGANRSAKQHSQKAMHPEWLGAIIGEHLLEVTELLVHIFDFMYFYGSNHESYVEGIWETWSTIPNISSRLSEYVVRTACALAVRHLPRPHPEVEAVKQLKGLLHGIFARNPDNEYVKEAIFHIHLPGDPATERQVAVTTDLLVLQRIQLVQLVHAYLFSPSLATRLQVDSMSKGGESAHGGYPMRERQIAPDIFSNPLNYVREFTRFATASGVESAILWQELAHYCQRENSSRG